MTRITIVLLVSLVAGGCSTTRKVVVRHGDPGGPPAPARFEPRPAPGPAAEEAPLRFR